MTETPETPDAPATDGPQVGVLSAVGVPGPARTAEESATDYVPPTT